MHFRGRVSGTMSEPEARRLADLIATLMRRHHLSIIHIMRTGGMARNTVVGLIRGTTRRPDPRTLQRFARAIATDQYTRILDHELMTEVHGILRAAGGFSEPTPDEAQTLVELGLYHQLQNRPRARRWLRALANDARISDAELDALAQRVAEPAEGSE